MSYRCSLDGAAWTTCPSPVSYSGLASGPHTLLVRAVDAAGSLSASTQYAWTVQTAAPGAPTIQGGPSTATITATASFRISAAPGTTLECSVDSARYRPCPDNVRLHGLGLGIHVLKVRQVDEAGNAGTPRSYRWTVMRRRTPAGLPRHATLLVGGQSTAFGSRHLDVGCNPTRARSTAARSSPPQLDGGSAAAPCARPGAAPDTPSSRWRSTGPAGGCSPAESRA